MPQMRMRSTYRSGKVKGLPPLQILNPKRIESRPSLPHHTCGECFGPRAHTNDTLFCRQCLKKLFAPGVSELAHAEYYSFLRSEARRQTRRRKRAQQS